MSDNYTLSTTLDGRNVLPVRTVDGYSMFSLFQRTVTETTLAAEVMPELWKGDIAVIVTDSEGETVLSYRLVS